MTTWDAVVNAFGAWRRAKDWRNDFMDRMAARERDMTSMMPAGRRKKRKPDVEATRRISTFIDRAWRAAQRMQCIVNRYDEVLQEKLGALDLAEVPRTDTPDTQIARHSDSTFSTTYACYERQAARKRAHISCFEAGALGFTTRVAEDTHGVTVFADIDAPAALAVRLLSLVTYCETLAWIWEYDRTINVKALFNSPFAHNWWDNQKVTEMIVAQAARVRIKREVRKACVSA